MEHEKAISDCCKRLVIWSKRYKSYEFHKRNKWLFYIPFYQIGYKWRISLWSHCLEHLKREIKLIEIIKEK